MLIRFNVSNFRSIKDEATLSLVANAGDDTLEHNIVKTSALKFPLVKQAAIYGPNAAGKSNLLMALKALRMMVMNSASGLQHGQRIPNIISYKLDAVSEKSPTTFDIIFDVAGIRYQYMVSTTAERVEHESLTAWPFGSAQLWFERDWDATNAQTHWKLGNKLEGSAAQKKLWRETTRENALFLSTAIMLNNGQLQPVFDWFVNKLIVVMPGKIEFNPRLTIERIQQPTGHEQLMDLLSAADIGIERIDIEEKSGLPLPPAGIPPEVWIHQILSQLPSDVNQLISTKISSVHKRVDGSEVVFNFEDESDGTRKLFEYAGGWLMALETGATLCVDEVDRSLHPVLVRMLVQLFASPMNRNNAQLIFTTHDTSLLDADLLRRDQVWFVEKEAQRETKLYSLLDYSPRKGENLERGYLLGRYGAIPFITEPDWVKHHG
ncbi:MAG: ATP-binding protein [Gammaproteobacteria bacterium]|nr:ATP-binding protein [Gammaproteobacteria bacterium]